jgi:hypothetical protein
MEKRWAASAGPTATAFVGSWPIQPVSDMSTIIAIIIIHIIIIIIIIRDPRNQNWSIRWILNYIELSCNVVSTEYGAELRNTNYRMTLTGQMECGKEYVCHYGVPT